MESIEDTECHSRFTYTLSLNEIEAGCSSETGRVSQLRSYECRICLEGACRVYMCFVQCMKRNKGRPLLSYPAGMLEEPSTPIFSPSGDTADTRSADPFAGRFARHIPAHGRQRKCVRSRELLSGILLLVPAPLCSRANLHCLAETQRGAFAYSAIG